MSGTTTNFNKEAGVDDGEKVTVSQNNTKEPKKSGDDVFTGFAVFPLQLPSNNGDRLDFKVIEFESLLKTLKFSNIVNPAPPPEKARRIAMMLSNLLKMPITYCY